MSTPVRFAIVGCGAIADAHATAIRSNDHTDLVAAVDPDESARQKAAEAWECPAFPSVDDLLRETEVDAACVCAPPAFHRGLTQQLLDAGVDVLCEKPLAPSLADAQAMVEHAERSGRVLMVSSKFRYVDDLHEAGELIRQGRIGEPIYGEVTFCAQVPVAGRWPVRPAISGGGVVMDNACHALDVLAEVLDEPISNVQAAFGPRTVSPDVEDTAEIQFRTESGTLGRLALSWTYFSKDLDYLMIQGTKGGIRVAWTGGLVRSHGEREWNSFGPGYDKRAAFDGLIGDFVEYARSGRTPESIADAVRAVELIESIYTAEGTGHWQDVGAAPLTRP
jgi:predicted dehydrogenase